MPLAIHSQFFRDGKAIANIEELSVPERTRETQSANTYGQTDSWNRYRGGMRDAGEMELTLIYSRTDTGQQALDGDFASDEPIDYAIHLADEDATRVSFSGLVTQLGVEVPQDDVIKRTVKIKVSGAIEEDTWAPKS